MSTIIQVPPLYIETKSVFVEEETMTRDEKGTSYDGEEHIKFMEAIFENMTKNIMKGFKFLAIQSWENNIVFKKTKGENALACLKEQRRIPMNHLVLK